MSACCFKLTLGDNNMASPPRTTKHLGVMPSRRLSYEAPHYCQETFPRMSALKRKHWWNLNIFPDHWTAFRIILIISRLQPMPRGAQMLYSYMVCSKSTCVCSLLCLLRKRKKTWTMSNSFPAKIMKVRVYFFVCYFEKHHPHHFTWIS